MMSRLKKVIKKNKIILKFYGFISYVFKSKNYARAKETVRKFTNTNDKKLIKDVCCSIAINKIQPSEYFLFKFNQRSAKERNTFVGYSERQEICVLPSYDILQKFTNKYECYLTYKPYFKRDVLLLNNKTEFAQFEAFVSKHKSFMVKNIKGFKGIGVKKMTIDSDDNIKSIYDDLLNEGESVIEELISQSKEMATFHPNSVNSIRYVTYYDNDEKKLTHLFTLVRMGCGGSVVDNAGSGGIIAAVDLEKGIVISDGYRENGEVHVEHPDSKVTIKGYQIPKWNELKNMIEELVTIVPQQKIIGWDFSLTDKGWVIIEVNHRPSFTGIQMCLQKGIRELIEKTFF